MAPFDDGAGIDLDLPEVTEERRAPVSLLRS